MQRLTALGVPCPWDGVEGSESDTWRYDLWFALYHRSRRIRHRIGLHDWVTAYPEGGPPRTRCSWCGRYQEDDARFRGGGDDA